MAPANADMHYALAKKIEDEEVEWIKNNDDGQYDHLLKTLGRDETDGFVDAVFMTIGSKSERSSS